MPTLRPTGGLTYCTVESGGFVKTYNGSVMDGCTFKMNQSCLSQWYWDNPVNVTKFNIYSLRYYPTSSIIAIWGRVDGNWIEVWNGDWKPSSDTWDSKVITCNNCTGIRISQKHVMQNWTSAIMEVSIDYVTCSDITAPFACYAYGCYWWNDSCHAEPKPPPVEGNAHITRISAPSEFTPNVPFYVAVDVTNDGGDDKLFFKFINSDTGEILREIAPSTIIKTGQIWSLNNKVVLTQTTAFHGRVESGHIE